MALTTSINRVDESGRELLSYGTPQFPIAFFDDDLTQVSVPYHWHDEFEFVIITEGTVQARIAGKVFDLSAGEGYFANSAVLHAETLHTPTGHQHAAVFAPGLLAGRQDLAWKTYVEPILGRRELPFIRLTSSVPWQREVLRLAESAWEMGACEKKDYPLHVRHCLALAFSLLVDHAPGLESEVRYTEKDRRDELRIKKALTFLEHNYDSAVTIEDIAESAGLGVSSCLRLFHSVLETTPVRYLVKLRLRKAAEMLERGKGRTIAEVAYACGFSDASYFNRCFRKEYGKTPSAFAGEERRRSGQIRIERSPL